MNQLLSLSFLPLLFVFSEIHCNNHYKYRSKEEDDSKYNSAVKNPISSPEDYLTLHNGQDVVQKLIRLLTDAEYREGRNKALETMSPRKDQLRPRIIDDDILDLIPDIPKVHMHHIFPPHIIRPLQKVIIQKMIHYIKKDPVKILKKKIKKKARIGTVVLGLGLGVRELKELKELKLRPPNAVYRVTGLVDLSGQKHKDYGDHGEHSDKQDYARYKRSVTTHLVDKIVSIT